MSSKLPRLPLPACFIADCSVARLFAFSLLLISVTAAAAQPPEVLDYRPDSSPGEPVYFREGNFYHFYSNGFTDRSDKRFWEEQTGLRLRLPEIGKPVRGIILGPDSYGAGHIANETIVAVAEHWNYGLLETESGPPVFDVLEVFASAGLNPELRHVPFVIFGNSAGGGRTWEWAKQAPERTIAFYPNVYFFRGDDAPPGLLETPGIISYGELDLLGVPHDGARQNLSGIRAARERDAQWAWFSYQGMGHETRQMSYLLLPFFEQMIRARYPDSADPTQGPVQLRDLPLESGWLAEDRHFHDPRTYTEADLERPNLFPPVTEDLLGTVDEGHVSREPGPVPIYPYDEYRGDPAEAFWLPNKDIAYLYRGLSSWDPKLDLNLLGYEHPGHSTSAAIRYVGEYITLVCGIDPSLGTWDRIVVYRGSTPVAERGARERWRRAPPEEIRFTIQLGGESVCQTFTAVAYNDDGDPLTTSRLAGLVVLPAPADWPPVQKGRPESTPGRAAYFIEGDTYHFYSNGFTDSTEEAFWEHQTGLSVRLPEIGKPVRGLIVAPDAAGAEHVTNDAIVSLAEAWNFGLVETQGAPPILECLDAFAAAGHNPELANAPFLVFGNSAGGRGTWRLAKAAPARTIAFYPNVYFLQAEDAPPELFEVPAIISYGELDLLTARRDAARQNLAAIRSARRNGARWAWFSYQGMGHETRLMSHLLLPFFEQMIEARYPDSEDPAKGPVTLRDLPLESGWLAEDLHFHDPREWTREDMEDPRLFPAVTEDLIGTVDEGHVSREPGPVPIYPYEEYPGDPAEAFWLPNKDIAYLYRGLSSWDPRITLTIEGARYPQSSTEAPVRHAGESLKLLCEIDEDLESVDRIVLYRGATPLVDLPAGRSDAKLLSFSFTVVLGDESLCQSFTAVAYDASGNPLSTSRLAAVVVLPSEAW